MIKLRNGMEKYGIFILLSLVIIVCLLKKDTFIETSVVSNPDTGIEFSTDNKMFEQTWQPHAKKISGVSIPYTSLNSFSACMSLKIYTDDKSILLIEKNFEYNFIQGEKSQIVLSFEPIDVKLGERLRIQLSYENVLDNGSILINAGNNYSGASVDGEKCDVGAALKMTVVKNSRLFWLFAVVFPLLAFSFLMMVIWGRKWEDVVGTSLIISVFFMYICGLLEQLILGIRVVYILSGLALLVAVYVYIKKKMTIRDLISPGMFIWGALLVLVFLNCSGLWLARSDEYTHWGLAVKDMFYYDSFGKHIDTTLIAIRYMPFSTLYEYLIVYLNGLFNEELLYVGFQICLLSLLIVVSGLVKNNRKNVLPTLAVMIFVPIIFFYDVSSCLYVDPLLAILIAYILICYYDEEITLFNCIRIGCGLFALVITKDIGVAIAGLLCLIMLADGVVRQCLLNKKIRWKYVISPVVFIVLILSFFMSWQIYLNVPARNAVEEKSINESHISEEVEDKGEIPEYRNAISASGMSLGNIIKIITGEGESYQYKTLESFIEKVFDGNTYQIGTISVSYMDIVLGISLILYGCSFQYYWKDKRGIFLSFASLSMIAGIGYAAFLALLYLLAFSREEALALASHERYLAAYAGGITIAFLYFICKGVLEKTKNEKKWFVVCIISMGLVIVSPVSSFIRTNQDFSITKIEKYGYSDLEEVMRSFADKGEKFYFVCSNSDGGSLRMFQNSACPMLVPYFEGNIAATEESIMMQEEINALNDVVFKNKTLLSVEEWERRLQSCQYVFILNADEAFKMDYAGIFEEPNTISNGTIYEVQENDDSIMLHFIGQVGFLTYLK